MEKLLSNTKLRANKMMFMALILIAALAMVLAFGSSAYADCGVKEGPTEIFEGMAIGDKDLTVYNDEIAFSLAVDSNNYWNMTKGSILDIGIRGANGTDGDMGVDLVNDVEFLNDLWTATGSYDGENLLENIKVEVTDKSTSKVVVEVTTRYWVADADKNGVDDQTQFGALQKPLDVILTYTLEDGNNYITLGAQVTNPEGNKVTYKNMYSGFSLSTLASSMFGPFGYYPDLKTTGIRIGDAESVQEAFGDFVVTYNTNYAVSVQMDGSDAYKGSSGYKDLYKLQDLEPNKTYDFTGEVLVSGESETASIMSRHYDRDGIAAENHKVISGKVVDSQGKAVAGAYVIAQKVGVYQETATSANSTSGHVAGTVRANMQPFVWDVTDAEGNYSLDLPKTGYQDGLNNVQNNGDYEYTFKVEAAGYTAVTSDKTSLTEDATKDFKLEDGAKVVLKAIDEKGNPIPFKVNIEGVKSEIKTLGGTTYFSDALNEKDPYTVSFTMTKAKDVTFKASYGANYESTFKSYTTDVTDEGVEYTFKIPTVVNPNEIGWYNADNHQHSDYGDGSTSIEDLFRAQMAAKLNFTVVSDHDSRIHNGEMAAMSQKAGVPFLSNTEVSPGWGHWGLLGVNYSDTDNGAIIDPTTAKPQDIIKVGHDNNAIVIVHHPYSDYGFLNNQASVNGGKEEGWDDFDLLELQSTMDLTGMKEVLTDEAWKSINMDSLGESVKALGLTNIDANALISAMAFWNQGEEKYLSAGSDQHDAASATLYPGIIRMYAHLGDGSDKAAECTVDNYKDALVNGKAYATMGPVLIPNANTEFGSTQYVKDGAELKLGMEVDAVNGLSEVTLWQNGKAVATKDYYKDSTSPRTKVSFTVTPDFATDNLWYSFTVKDAEGNYAVTNPIWVKKVVTDVAVMTDVPASAWHYDYVKYVLAEGIMKGTSATTFEPNANITRGQFVTILGRLAGVEDSSAQAPATTKFSDVEGDTYYASHVAWAVEKGIVEGTSATTFEPKAQITRQDLATMIGRYATAQSIALPAASDKTFADDADIAKYAKDYVYQLKAAGILEGKGDNLFAPKANATRAEAAKIINLVAEI